MNKDIEKNLQALVQKITPLPYVLEKLETANIRYGLYAGSHVAALVSNRVPTDVDFLVHDDDVMRLKETFPFAKTKDEGKGLFLYIGNDDVVEFMSQATVIKEGGVYPFRLTDLAVSRITTYEVDSVKIRVVDAVDTLLLKAILRRGPEQGKHDLEDIKAVLASIQLDVPYLRERLIEADATAYTKDIWQEFNIAL